MLKKKFKCKVCGVVNPRLFYDRIRRICKVCWHRKVWEYQKTRPELLERKREASRLWRAQHPSYHKDYYNTKTKGQENGRS